MQLCEYSLSLSISLALRPNQKRKEKLLIQLKKVGFRAEKQAFWGRKANFPD
jgi:hypothetical protein